jgi:hypothetical protein
MCRRSLLEKRETPRPTTGTLPSAITEPAQATRHKFYDMASAEKALVVGFDFTFPSMGHVEKNCAKYRLVPIAWNPLI